MAPMMEPITPTCTFVADEEAAKLALSVGMAATTTTFVLVNGRPFATVVTAAEFVVAVTMLDGFPVDARLVLALVCEWLVMMDEFLL